jgi:hypothetical protein
VALRRDDLARAAGDEARRRADPLAGVQEEIRQAQAEALGRTGGAPPGPPGPAREPDRRLDALLVDGAVARDARADRLRRETEARKRVRDEAIRVRHQLVVQREAPGFARQVPVEQCYPVPGRRSAAGPVETP